MLKYYRSLQCPKRSYHVNIPENLVSILDFKPQEVVSLELLNDNSKGKDKSEKVIVIRKLENESENEIENHSHNLKINVIT